NLKIKRRMKIFFALLTVGGFAAFLWAFFKMLEVVAKFGQGVINPQQQNIAVAIYALAVVVGMSVGLLGSSVASYAAALRLDDRKNRLLVKCWDAMTHLLETSDTRP